MPVAGQVMKPLVALGRDHGDCWRWLGATDAAGYARKEFNGKPMLAKRWLWEQLFGPLPEGLVVSTSCGERDCVNPHHMRACTQAEANRAGSGAVLLPADVLDIRKAKRDRTDGLAAALALRYGCSKQAIYDIWGGRAWARKPHQRKSQGAAKDGRNSSRAA